MANAARLPQIVEESGRGDWIRTSDPLLPKQVRYQATLRPDTEEWSVYRISDAHPSRQCLH